MQKMIEQLQCQVKTTLPAFDPLLSTWFLLDRVRGKKTLNQFYQNSNMDVIAYIQPLLQNTVHSYLIEASPLLIKVNPTQLSEEIYQCIQDERSGLFIQSQCDDILSHLNHLFIMQSETQGKVYTRFYDPICWAALQLSCVDQMDVIWGPLDKVYTPSAQSHIDKLSYYNWSRSTTYNESDHTLNAILLGAPFDNANQTVQLMYFAYEAARLQSIHIDDSQVMHTLLNLKQMVKHGLQNSLYKMIKPCVEIPCFTQDERVQQLLLSDMVEFKKRDQLIELAKGIGQKCQISN